MPYLKVFSSGTLQTQRMTNKFSVGRAVNQSGSAFVAGLGEGLVKNVQFPPSNQFGRTEMKSKTLIVTPFRGQTN